MKKSKLSIIFLGLLLLLMGCLQASIALAADNSALVITKANEFIDIDKSTVKFLFRTDVGAKVEFYLGQNPDDLKVVKSADNFDFQKGLFVDNLTPGAKYYYKIVAQKDGNSAESSVLTFDKLDNIDTAQKAEWARKAVFYEIFVRSFADGNGDGIGDFKGLKEKIGYLKDLKVDALWLMPCFDSPSYHGYDVVNYYKIEPDYGTNEDFIDFLKEAHKNGIKVILDLVANHTAADHPWFIESQDKTKQNNEFRDYYVWQDKFDNLKQRGPWDQAVWQAMYGETEDDDQYFYAVFGGGMPDLNFRNYKVREEMKKVAKFWLDNGVDGFRLDAAMHIDNLDMDVTHNWWQEFDAYVKAINPNAFIIGEDWSTTKEIAPFFKDLDSSFNFPLQLLFLDVFKGKNVDLLAQINNMYNQYKKYDKNFMDSTFITNHDMNRIASELGGDKKKEKLAAALLLTLPGTPFIYYGDELGQLGTKPDENIREALDWYASAKGKDMVNWLGEEGRFTLPNDGISVQEEAKKADSVLNYYKKLIKVRKENPVFFDGKYVKVNTVSGTYGYEVSGSILVVHNLDAKAKKLVVKKAGIELLTSKAYKANASISVEPFGTVIVKYGK